MSDFQLSQIALIAARMSAFKPMGVTSRGDLTMRRVAPLSDEVKLQSLDDSTRKSTIREQLPIWVHNLLVDPGFPYREKLLPSLRRFEGELRDNKNDEVVSAVLSHGFRNQDFNPLDLPKDMSMRDRCAILAHIKVWEEAFLPLEESLVKLLSDQAESLDRWCDYARHPDHQEVE